MLKAFPQEFRGYVEPVTKTSGESIEQIARDFGITATAFDYGRGPLPMIDLALRGAQ